MFRPLTFARGKNERCETVVMRLLSRETHSSEPRPGPGPSLLLTPNSCLLSISHRIYSKYCRQKKYQLRDKVFSVNLKIKYKYTKGINSHVYSFFINSAYVLIFHIILGA